MPYYTKEDYEEVGRMLSYYDAVNLDNSVESVILRAKNILDEDGGREAVVYLEKYIPVLKEKYGIEWKRWFSFGCIHEEK